MSSDGSRRRFATTRWSLVLTAGDRVSPESETALATLCESYWYPVYAFVRGNGHDSDDARDLTQAFFTRLLEKEFLRDARPERGRFRSFLYTAVRHFLANEHDWRRALKRGGGRPHLPLEFEAGERRYQLEPTDDLTPERVYERRWAQGVFDSAMQSLAARHSSPEDRRRLFARLKPFLTGDSAPASRELASELGMSEGALRVALHRLRRQFGTELRRTIAETVDRADDVDDELRHLVEVMSR